ncbi:hypothetical protein GC169_02630 [bacterium]|nr:hypothetical protein [bacterium]
MKLNLMTTAAIVACLGIAGVAGIQAGIAAPAPAATADVKIAPRADNFQLTDQNRMHHELHYYKYAPAIALMTYSNGSDFSAKAAAEFEKLAASYADKGVLFFLMNSETGVSREEVAARAASLGLDLPVLMDELQLVGESLGATREGEVFVFNPKTWEVAYHGPLDTRFEKAAPKTAAKVKQAYTAAAIDAMLAGQPVSQARVALKSGKSIAFPARREDHTKISYSADVAPILQAKCVSCHLDGGIAPFAMDSYEIVKGFAPMIRESVRTDRMPPYFADPHIGTFQHDQGLTPDETKTLIHWIEAGAPRGEGPDVLKLEARKASDWPESLGEPDYIVDVPAFDVPASGIVEYQHQLVDNPFTEDKWLRAVSVKPGDRSVLHHLISNHRPDPKLKATASGLPSGSVGSYTPGAEAQTMGENAGAPIPAGGKLYFQMHYTTTGKATTDKTQVGFYFAKEKPKYIKRATVIGDFSLKIPAGAQRHAEVAYLEFPADAYLMTLYPHAHYRGTHNELTAIYPDGRKEVLLSLPKYDFNWQRDYNPVEQIFIPAGTKLVSKWVYDNSVHNPANPDPSIDVTWGEQTFQEMAYFRVNYRWAEETSDNVRNDLDAKLNASRTIGALDDNVDGLVQINELRGPMARLAANFAKMDKDGNGGLDRAELAASGVSRSSVPDADIEL